MPLVHVVLVDPVPEARATAAKALGTLIERLGEANFPDMVSNLLQTLKTDTSGVDRQGAAQGLSEVLSGLGMERMEGLLPEVIASVSSPRPYVREGFMSLLVYLPATFGHRFTPHLARIIPPILNGLADSEELVRSAAMKAGRMIVSNYSNKAIDLLLPELEKGMFDSGWRIRVSNLVSITLHYRLKCSRSIHPLPWSENFCSACRASAERQKSKKTKRSSSTLQLQKALAVHSLKLLAKNVGIACLLHFTLLGKIRSQQLGWLRSIFGRRWYLIPQGLVSWAAYMLCCVA